MATAVSDLVLATLASFREAKVAIGTSFSADSAAEIVSAVVNGKMPRRGRCSNGLEYFVHGVGYTVITEAGGQAHIDSCGADGDCFSVYDVRFFMETAGFETVPDIADIRSACQRLATSGVVRQLDPNRFSIV
jgi:hypothetical protein